MNFSLPLISDNSGETITPVGDAVSGSAFPVGTTAVNFTAQDSTGNVNTCAIDIAVTGKPFQYKFD